MTSARIVFGVKAVDEFGNRLTNLFGRNGDAVLPVTSAAFEQIALNVQSMWQGWAMGAPLAGAETIKKPSPNIARSIGIERRGAFDASVGSDDRRMEAIQRGRKRQDMKQTYPYGRKSRVSASGVPYLIVPFRWGTPGKGGSARWHFGSHMNKEVYEAAKALAKSKTTGGTHGELNARGENVQRAEYAWGGRLKTALDENGYSRGMVRMSDVATGNSTYFTFRIISAKSRADSWIKEEVPPNDVVTALANAAADDAAKLLEEGLKADFGAE